MIVGALVVAGALAYLGVRRPGLALVGVGALAAVGIAASLAQPFVAPVPTVITILAALALGVAVTETLLRLRPPGGNARAGGRAQAVFRGPATPIVRSGRRTRPRTAVGRRGFLLLGGGAAVAGLAAAGRRTRARGPGRSGVYRPQTAGPPESHRPGPRRTMARRRCPEVGQARDAPAAAKDASIDAPGMAQAHHAGEQLLPHRHRLDLASHRREQLEALRQGRGGTPVEFSYKDLLGMCTREADITLSCVSNEVGGGLVSNGRWTGVLLSDVLAEAGWPATRSRAPTGSSWAAAWTASRQASGRI